MGQKFECYITLGWKGFVSYEENEVFLSKTSDFNFKSSFMKLLGIELIKTANTKCFTLSKILIKYGNTTQAKLNQ